ncbi:hypothetical protein Cgig2_021915 [Carnegiea gigantea]|uniref:Uncharacterized protein n=1 Tax=Carnegiea gigantea TaxID=171969 RepID=A0A9Q1GTU5_9CARY|nr:hypothetical protein Cgig2_021915 [Carnegiea gigantea]
MSKTRRGGVDGYTASSAAMKTGTKSTSVQEKGKTTTTTSTEYKKREKKVFSLPGHKYDPPEEELRRTIEMFVEPKFSKRCWSRSYSQLDGSHCILIINKIGALLDRYLTININYAKKEVNLAAVLIATLNKDKPGVNLIHFAPSTNFKAGLGLDVDT